jgi:hypothetical protein
MHGHRRRSTRYFAGVGLVALCSSSCISGNKGAQRLSASHLAVTATGYNLAMEQTQNEMLLLNAIRAMNHQPMYITDASKVTGTVKVDLSLGLKLPIEYPHATDYTIMPNIDYSTSPAMDVNLLNSKDFMTGFLATIPQEFFAYYWDQGWPPEFILYLLVLKVDVYQKEGDKWSLQCTLWNHPDVYANPEFETWKAFADWVDRRVSTGRRARLRTEDAVGAIIGPAWPPPAPPPPGAPPAPMTLDQVAAVAAGLGLSLSQEGDRFRLSREKKVYTLVPFSHEKYECPAEKEEGNEPRSWVELTEKMPSQFVMGSRDDPTVFALSLRSPEGVLYYLGQLARLEAKAGRALLIHIVPYPEDCEENCGPSLPLPLFVALSKPDHDCSGDSASVRSLDRTDYFIPRDDPKEDKKTRIDEGLSRRPLLFANTSGLCSAGRSMMALELVAQLIGLQKPPTGGAGSATGTAKDSGGGSGSGKPGKSGPSS